MHPPLLIANEVTTCLYIYMLSLIANVRSRYRPKSLAVFHILCAETVANGFILTLRRVSVQFLD